MKLNIKISQSKESITQSQKIRYEVFFKEQGIPTELDLDGKDNTSYHVLAFVNRKIIGVARLTPINNEMATLSRVEVVKEYRGSGIASKLVKTAMVEAEKLNLKYIEVTPHEYLREFYEVFGFKFSKNINDVCGHRLIKMEKSLKHCFLKGDGGI